MSRNLYKSCMDEDLIEDSSMEDARDILEELGGWPVLLADKWEAENFTWYGLAEKANLLGFDTSRILSASESSSYAFFVIWVSSVEPCLRVNPLKGQCHKIFH